MIPITSEKHNYTIWCDTKVTFQATHALASSMILDDIRELHLIPSQYLALLHLEIHIYLQQSIQIRSDFFRKLKSSSAVSTTKILCFKQKPSNKGQTWDLVQKRGDHGFYFPQGISGMQQYHPHSYYPIGRYYYWLCRNIWSDSHLAFPLPPV